MSNSVTLKPGQGQTQATQAGSETKSTPAATSGQATQSPEAQELVAILDSGEAVDVPVSSSRGSASRASNPTHVTVTVSTADGAFEQTLESYVHWSHGDARSLAPKDVGRLAPDLNRVYEPDQLPQKFASDYALVRDQLVEHPRLKPESKAERVFEFFANYAEKFVALAGGLRPQPADAKGKSQGEGQSPQPEGAQGFVQGKPLPPEEKQSLVRKFADVLQSLGFSELREKRTGQNGVEVAREVLQAKTPEEAQHKAQTAKFDAPANWPPTDRFGQRYEAPPPPQLQQKATPDAPTLPHARTVTPPQGTELKAASAQAEVAHGSSRARGEAERAAHAEQVRANVLIAQGGKVLIKPVEVQSQYEPGESTGQSSRHRGKVLGSNMLWNWLHRYREGADAFEEGHIGREQLDRMAFAAVLLLLAGALAAIVLAAF